MHSKNSAIILLGLLQILLMALQTEAYCVYNNIKNRDVYIYQNTDNTQADRLSVFKRTVQPRTRECCPKTSPTCSKADDENIRLKLHVQILKANNGGDVNDGIIVPAGGYLEISESENTIYYGVYNADDTIFPFETYAL
ncbi:hypothetical protein BD408DRAFT_441733 [Parasitella parasitica]|nr:hypothetical protein BD408DRAFT_441733 [Parasitella parasitica]